MEKIEKLPECLHFAYTVGIIPTSYKISKTYEEQLMWYCHFLETEVIPTVNNNAMAVQELQHWFENLDVQEEIDKKLDEMTEDGTLQEIITQYIQMQGLTVFNTVSDMKQGENLINGSIVRTFGFHTLDDDGGATYKIRNVTNQDVINEMNLIALADESLVAELMIDIPLNIRQLGAYGDKTHNDTDYIKQALTISNDVFIPNGNYLIDDKITISNGKVVKGEDRLRTAIYYNGTGTAIEIKYKAFGTCDIEKFSLYKNNTPTGYDENDTTSHGIEIVYNSDTGNGVTNLLLKDVMIRYFYINFYSPTSNAYTNCRLEDCAFQSGHYNMSIVGGFNNYYDNCQFTGAEVGLRQRTGELNCIDCKFENNIKAVRLENPGGRHGFINCFFENTTTNDSNIYLLQTVYNEDQADMNAINFYNCHFYGAYNQLYLGRVKKVNAIGCGFVGFGHQFLEYSTSNVIAEDWNFMGCYYDSVPSDFKTTPFIHLIDEMTKDTGWVDIDVTNATRGTFSGFKMRKIGKLVKWKGYVTGLTETDESQTFGVDIPQGFRPDDSYNLITGMRSSTGEKQPAMLRVYANGTIQLRKLDSSTASSDIIDFDNITYFTT